MSDDPEKIIRDCIQNAEEFIAPGEDHAEGNEKHLGRRKGDRSDILQKIADEAEPFHTPEGKPFADINVNRHRETWPIRSRQFMNWLRKRYFDETGAAPNRVSFDAVLDQLEAKAIYGGPQREVFVRVAHLGENTYLDLADANWRAVEITPDGWRLVDEPPVRFLRATGMFPLPCPDQKGLIDDLRRFINVRTEDDFVLISSWLLAAIGCRGPYPVLVFLGERGSAKSSTSAFLRALVDPNHAPLRSLPRNEHELFIAATHAQVLAFDNVSSLSRWQSDAFCRLATGGGHGVRRLYTDEQEVLYNVRRPLILNGIDSFVTRDDLADRCIFVTTEPIPAERRLSEARLWADFEQERPGILGALLNVLSHALRHLPRVKARALPRLADYAMLSIASEPAMWPAGRFEKAFSRNRAEAVQIGLETDPVALALFNFVARTIRTNRTIPRRPSNDEADKITIFVGTASDLLIKLQSETNASEYEGRLPRAPQTLSDQLTRAAPILRELGIIVERHRDPGSNRTRVITVQVEVRKFVKQWSSSNLSEEAEYKEDEVSLEPSEGAAEADVSFAEHHQIDATSSGSSGSSADDLGAGSRCSTDASTPISSAVVVDLGQSAPEVPRRSIPKPSKPLRFTLKRDSP